MDRHKAEPRATTDIQRRGIALGLIRQRCKCGRYITEVERPGVDGFGPEAFYWRHLPRNNA